MGGSSKGGSTQTQTIPARTEVTPVQRNVSVVVGYKYYFGAHMALTHGPVDFVSRIKVGDKCAWSGLAYGQPDDSSGLIVNKNTTGIRINISASNLFGGVDGEGGVVGPVDFLQGYDTQGVNDYLAARLGGADGTPAFRGVTSMVLRQVYVSANNPYLKPWAFTMTRTTSQDALESEPWSVETSSVPCVFDYSSPEPDPELGYVNAADTDCPYNNDGDIAGRGNFRVYYDSVLPEPPESWVEADTVLGGTGGFLTLFSVYCGTDPEEGPNGVVARNPNDFDNGARMVCPAGATAVLSFGQSTGVLFGGCYQIPDEPEPEPELPPECVDLPTKATCESGPCIDMNPAHIIRECLTDKEWGMGYSVDDVDDDSFIAAADTLFDEELGISLLWDRETTIEAFIKEITRHIDAALYVDRRTGKFKLKLIRDDYSASDLITLDPTNIERVENYRRPSFGELVNTVTVLYMECPDDVQGSVTVQDIALIQAQGGSIGATVEYMGFSNRTNAQYAATRDLRQLALPLLSCTIYTGPDAASLDIGDTFKFEWSDYHEDSIVMRVVGMAFGDGKTNSIKIDCVQDVFGTPEAPLLSNDVSLWNNPNQPPGPVEHQIVEEIPYWLGVRLLSGVDDFLNENPDSGVFAISAAPPFVGLVEDSDGVVYYGNAISATVNYNDGTEWFQVALTDFCPYAEVAGYATSDGSFEEEVGYVDDQILITNISGIDLVFEGQFAQIGNEIIRVDSVNNDSDGNVESITVGRGCLDTVPTKHAVGTKIFFWQSFFGSDYSQYFAGETYTYALRPRNNTGIVPLADALQTEMTFDSRTVRPYPPGNVRINGVYYPENLNGELLSIEWSHRDRLQQTGEVIVDTLEGNIGPEDGTTYVVQIEDTLGNVLIQENNITGTSWDEDSNNLIEEEQFIIKLYSERDAASSSDPYQSWQQHVIPMLRNAPVDSSSGFGSSDIFASSSETVVEWTPAEITTALWLDAADADTITLNGSNVSQWDDKSGNLRHATQGTALDQPEYDSVNNRVVFDKANTEFMGLASQPFTGTTPRTVIAVVNSVTYGSLGNSYFSASNYGPTATGKVWDLSIESDGFYIRIAGNDYFTPAVTNNTDALIVAQWESGSSSNSNVWHDGSALSRAGGSSQTINTRSGTARIGRSEVQPNQYFDGYIYELIVVADTLSTNDRQKFEGYLAWKWGLEANLPSGHPYELSPPTV